MRNRKARLTLCVGAIAVAAGFATPAHAQPTGPATALATVQAPADTTPAVYGRAAYLLDASTGKALLGRNADTRMPIASLTKTMTAYVVLQSAKPTDMVEITPEDVRYAVNGGGTSAYLRAGDRLPVKELLYGLMLPSGADAAHALARAYGPGVPGFVAKMNDTARRLGMTDTEYVNADGLPMPGGDGHSTARDQALLGVKALENPLLKQVTATRRHTVEQTADHRSYTWTNTNKLLGAPGALGLKTGFTRAAGFSLAFAGERDGRLLVGVLLGETVSSRRFDTARTLLEWGARQA
ncbi:D-alanyl-D-alanine carboxypeptidase family protein [Nonomuraea sp. NPDC048916]|uniref:D-alanyl-D-alanine carboxypeptidase family protein n=1 Tax=Nonomuraea sp. NPDC048916 TaxID=3154232 RepID=UPI0033D4C7FB